MVKQAIGLLKSKKKVTCTICTDSITRVMTEKVFSKNDSEVSRAKESLTKRLNKPYTCKVCKDIVKGI